jgi:positive regulator of sigma E activity
MAECTVNAVVVEINGKKALIQTEAADKCNSCDSSLCGMHKSRTLKLSAPNVAVGDKIILKMPGSSIIFISFMLYIAGIPIATLAAYIATRIDEVMAAVTFLITITLWLVICSLSLSTYARRKIQIIA